MGKVGGGGERAYLKSEISKSAYQRDEEGFLILISFGHIVAQKRKCSELRLALKAQ